MSLRQRRLLGVLTLLVWSVWVTCIWATASHDVAVVEVAEVMLRMVTVVLSVAWLLAKLVGPLAETARIWMEIGRQEQRRQGCPTCDHGDPPAWVQKARGGGGDVIPLRPVRRVNSDN